ncbi:ABC transporter ATP-binding protein [Candidatus Bathyarchaeota archaeon A05DMB-2]|nr:ABC transporter ATP-binding protein [Candidatus Bathyarchaeota archaeon A05DMB-2]
MEDDELLIMQNENAIETFGLTKTFYSKLSAVNGRWLFRHKENRIVTAVDHLSLEIKRGELFGLLGPNGAGKTTLVKMLCTLLPPDEGTARVNGFDVLREQMSVKQSLGTLFSVGERGFFWRLSGYRNLEFYAAIYNVPREKRKERIMEVLNLVGLGDNGFQLYQKYSGGMKRKLSLARTLLPDPPILLLDEPTTGLDVIASRNIRDFIKNTLSKERCKTVLYTTHYVEEAAQICDRVAIMNRGRLVALDTPDAVRDMIKKAELVDIVVGNITEAQVNAIKGLEGVVNIVFDMEDKVMGQRHLQLQLESLDSLRLVFDYLFKQKIRLVNFRREEPTLEDAFIELTERSLKERA